MPSTQLLWFKRDLRLQDHAALHAACEAPALLPIFCIEPSLWQAEDASPRQFAFVREGLQSLDAALRLRGSRLCVLHGEVVAMLELLWQQCRFTQLLSHQETGNAISYARDLAVADWCRSRGVVWQEFTQDGVVRRLRSRDGWAARWAERMAGEPLPPPETLPPWPPLDLSRLPRPEAWYSAFLQADPCTRQPGGRAAAEATLESFLATRSERYRGGISSPNLAEQACSRLSPHLAWGLVSMREVVSAVRARRAVLQTMPEAGRPPRILSGLAAFEARLHWHCHFMQKLESEPAIEHHNMLRSFDGMREEAFNREHFERWCAGETGYPLIDACMRKLQATGWLNFRMRAMLVSFAAFPLWLHWREPGLHLARLFVDYEPGIHWSQMQMQSGTTGINALRIYNPVKQARDQDPQGRFVRHWLPALAQVPDDYIFEPWLMPESLQVRVGCRIGRDYPAPIVAFEQATREAKARLAEYRRLDETHQGARAVLEKHGSRKSGLRQSGAAARETRRKRRSAEDGAQLELL
ncbi:deoxyribodipyrimidine photo-lyase [Viridibacterium curvum]|uniref:Deoxyribodipyrimidine photo-lyase n=1 Tax=Viridibacterium curvum TaxID=1101404 RepID=A0ABP9QHF5_9RHOO